MGSCHRESVFCQVLFPALLAEDFPSYSRNQYITVVSFCRCTKSYGGKTPKLKHAFPSISRLFGRRPTEIGVVSRKVLSSVLGILSQSYSGQTAGNPKTLRKEFVTRDVGGLIV